jgi:threonine/homoserine/homoserine lactone efflux protein
MDPGLFLRGLLIGFSIAAPVGPIGVLVIRRTLAEGRLAGLATGLGAATADALYGGVAGFGLTFVTSLLVGQLLWVRLIGGLFLCYLGVRAFLAVPAERAASAAGSSLLGAYCATLLLTLTNPMTILSFAAVFAGLGLAATSEGATEGHPYSAAALLVLGVFAGSALWWLLLSGGVGLLRLRLTSGALRWVNRVSGAIVVGFGVLALVSLG